jgi:hypothetical protein
MSDKKSTFSFASLSSRSRKFKPFSLNKCFQLAGLTKKILACKSNRNKNVNYEYFSYQKAVNNSKSSDEQIISFMDMTNQPATSTMIETQSSSYNKWYTYEEEETCKSCLISDQSPDVSRQIDNDMTIVHHNNKSPIIHNYYNLDSCHEYEYDYMHSTKFEVPENKTATNLASLMIDQSSIMASPRSASTSYASSSNESMATISDELFCQISAFETIIEGLSVTIEEDNGDETHVVASDYEATFMDDVTVQFADTVKILKDNNDEWLYVQVASDGRKGYLPRTIVMDLKQFIQQLRDQHRELLSKSQIN